MTNPQLNTWLKELSDDDLIAWANRGLLRRGRKLADSLYTSICEVVESGGYQATIENHQQTLDNPGFDQLHCSCPAAATCHHLIAFLLCLQQQVSLSTATEPDNSTEEIPAPWLTDDFAALSKQLGNNHIKRAQRLLLQGAEVVLEDNASGNLVATVTERSRHQVRISRSSGLSAALCSCNAERCVHRALAVLYARQQAQLYDPLAESISALTEEQNTTIAQIQHWLRELMGLGLSGLSRSLSERGEALATVARQADLPLLSSQISALCQLQQDELAGRGFIQIGQFRQQLALLWLRLRSLQANPLPRPLLQLGGMHKRDYQLIQNLRLIGIGAERWQSKTGYMGLTLHLYAPEQNVWYRHTQARGVTQAELSDWSPLQCWRRESWAGFKRYNKIPGSELRLLHGWGTDEGQLSGREGTRLQLIGESQQDTSALPVDNDFALLAGRYRQALSADPVALPPRLPVLISIASADEPVFNKLDQRWSQRVYDAQNRSLELIVNVSDAITAAALESLTRWQKRKRWQYLFGHLTLHGHSLALYPVSLRCRGEQQWRHPTLT